MSQSAYEGVAAPDAFAIGSQTASVGQTLTVDNTPVVVQTSAGQTQLYAGSAASPAVLSFAAATTEAASTITGAPSILTIGVETVSRNSAGAYMLGSQTLTPGGFVTEGSGSSTALVGVQINNGTTQLVIKEASSTETSALAMITKPMTSSSKTDDSSVIVVNGHTYLLGATSLNAGMTETGTASSASGFATSSVGGADSASASSGYGMQTSAASRTGNRALLLGGLVAIAVGVVALL